LATLDNVLLAPHCIAWTDELFRDIGHMACEQVLKIAQGEVPHGVVNKEVLERPGFKAKLERYKK
jgi:phosphoglycerate dehydrogenase-like enzyme